jgi:hypothetical protein
MWWSVLLLLLLCERLELGRPYVVACGLAVAQSVLARGSLSCSPA